MFSFILFIAPCRGLEQPKQPPQYGTYPLYLLDTSPQNKTFLNAETDSLSSVIPTLVN